MIYIIHRKHVFDGGSRQSWNAVTAYSKVYRTGFKDIAWSKDFHYKNEAVAWCKEHGLSWMTEKEWDAEWLKALDDGLEFYKSSGEDPYQKTADILNQKWFLKEDIGLEKKNLNPVQTDFVDYPLDGLRRALERFDGEKGVVGICGPWAVYFRDYQQPRYDATIYKICFNDNTLVYCNWENMGDPNKECIVVNRVHGGD